MNKDETMQQALEQPPLPVQQQAKPVQKPVAWRFKDLKDGHWLYTTHITDLSKKYWRLKNELFEPLYTAPPQENT